MRKHLTNIGLLFASLVFVLVVGEVAVRIAYPRLADYNLEMWRYSADLKQPLDRKSLPFFHFPNREGRYYGVNIKTNAEGFRNAECSRDKPKGKSRILMIGDSLTLGWGVPVEDTIPSNLGRLMNGNGDLYDIINIGVGNYNTTMETDLFEWKGLALHPDVAILVYYVNDAEPVPHYSRIACALRKRSYLLAFLFDRYVVLRPRFDKNFRWLDYYAALYAPDAPGLAENRAAIRHLAELCRENKVQLLIASYPELHELKKYPLPEATEHIRSMAAECRVPFVDLLPALAPYDPKTLWVSDEDTHGNGLACRIAAETISEALRGVLPLKQ